MERGFPVRLLNQGANAPTTLILGLNFVIRLTSLCPSGKPEGKKSETEKCTFIPFDLCLTSPNQFLSLVEKYIILYHIVRMNEAVTWVTKVQHERQLVPEDEQRGMRPDFHDAFDAEGPEGTPDLRLPSAP